MKFELLRRAVVEAENHLRQNWNLDDEDIVVIASQPGNWAIMSIRFRDIYRDAEDGFRYLWKAREALGKAERDEMNQRREEIKCKIQV